MRDLVVLTLSAAAGVGAAGVAALRLRLRGVPEVGLRVPESACADAAFVSGDAAVQSGVEGSSDDAWRDLPLTSLRDKLRRFAVRLGATASVPAATPTPASTAAPLHAYVHTVHAGAQKKTGL